MHFSLFPLTLLVRLIWNTRALFSLFYEVVLGQERGPRFGSFARMVGVEKVRDMINARLA